MNGDHATDFAIKVIEEYGADLKEHRATNIRNIDIAEMDLILCATTLHKINIVDMYPTAKDKTYTIKEYAGYDETDLEIEDPWGYSIRVYRKCVAEIDMCLDKIINKI